MADQADCLCRRMPYAHFQGDDQRRHPEMIAEPSQDADADPLRLVCAVCGTRWRISRIHGGGIYGDVEWERVT